MPQEIQEARLKIKNQLKKIEFLYTILVSSTLVALVLGLSILLMNKEFSSTGILNLAQITALLLLAFRKNLRRESDLRHNKKLALITISSILLTALLLSFRPLKELAFIEIIFCLSLLTVFFRLCQDKMTDIELIYKICDSTITLLFAINFFRFLLSPPFEITNPVLLYKSLFITAEFLILLVLDRIVISLQQEDKRLHVEEEYRRSLEFKSNLIKEINEHLRQPLQQVRIFVDSLRHSSYGTFQESAFIQLRKLEEVQNYLQSLYKINEIEEEKVHVASQAIKEIGLLYENELTITSRKEAKNMTINSNVIFGLHSILDFALSQKSKYCSLELWTKEQNLLFEITFDGTGMSDHLLKKESLKANPSNRELASDFNLGIRILQKEGFEILMSTKLLQGTRFLIFPNHFDTKEFYMEEKNNALL
jgi:hypothetical protein